MGQRGTTPFAIFWTRQRASKRCSRSAISSGLLGFSLMGSSGPMHRRHEHSRSSISLEKRVVSDALVRRMSSVCTWVRPRVMLVMMAEASFMSFSSTSLPVVAR